MRTCAANTPIATRSQFVSTLPRIQNPRVFERICVSVYLHACVGVRDYVRIFLYLISAPAGQPNWDKDSFRRSEAHKASVAGDADTPSTGAGVLYSGSRRPNPDWYIAAMPCQCLLTADIDRCPGRPAHGCVHGHVLSGNRLRHRATVRPKAWTEKYNEKIRQRRIKRRHVDIAQNAPLFIAGFCSCRKRFTAVVFACILCSS